MLNVRLPDQFSDMTTFHEAIKDGRVDRAKGIIQGVKLMGFDSLNGRSYNKPSQSLFEGVRVRLDHYAEEDDPSPPSPEFGDNWGFIRNARVTESGVFGDIVYNPTHPDVPSILWWAENNPTVGGFSPITWGYESFNAAGETIMDIVKVESVDLVDRPATTHGFFEGVKTMDPKEVIKLQESLAAKTVESATLATKLAESERALADATTKLTKATEDLKVANGTIAATAEAGRIAAKRTERLKLVADTFGETKVSEEFKAQVVAASTDDGAKVLVETLKDALGAPKSNSTNPGTDGPAPAVKNYEEAKAKGILSY